METEYPVQENTMIIRKEYQAVLFAVCIMALASWPGCGQQDTDVSPATTQHSAAPSTQPAAASLTEEECLAFGESIELFIEEGNAQAFTDKIDLEAVMERATGDFKDMEEARRAFMNGVRDSMMRSHGVAGQIISQAELGGSYRLLRVHEKDGHKRALFRMLLPDQGGVNYHDWLLEKRPNGEIKAVDIYIFLSAELLSVSWRRGFLPLAAEASKSFLARLTSSESEYIKNIEKLPAMTRALRSGQHHQALEVYNKMPESMQRDKNILILKIQATSMIGCDEHMATLEDFRRFHPDDACIDMMSIDVHTYNEDFDKALACLDRLERSVGGDPYLNVLRASTLLLQGKDAEAKKLAGKAIEEEETLLDAYWALITVSLRQNSYDETLALMNDVESNFDVEFYDLETIPDYAGFIESPQYQQWLASKSQ